MYWLISADSKIYDYFKAFNDLDWIDWKMNNTKYNVGDIVYIYSTRPYKKIMFKCEILKINIPYNDMMQDLKYWKVVNSDQRSNTFTRFKLLKTFNDGLLSLEALQSNGLLKAPQGPIKLSNKTELLGYIKSVEEQCAKLDYFEIEKDIDTKILFCNIAPMEKYEGIEKNAVLSGGKYVEQHGVGFELFNFLEVNGHYYGFVQPPIGNLKNDLNNAETNKFKLAKIRIERLGASKKEEFIDGVTIVWVTTIPNQGRTIIGWYQNARLYRNQQLLNNEDRKFAYPNGEIDIASYYMVCKVEDALLIPINNRKFILKKKILGQANIGYGNKDFNQEILQYIKDYDGPSIYDKYALKKIIDTEIENIPDKYKESIIKTRIGQSSYRASLISKFNGKCALCGIKGNELLIASHIKAWKDCEDGEHLDENNGLLLCPNHDKIFDKH